MSGYAPDVKIQAEELLRMQRKIQEILAHHTGQTVKKIDKDFNRDHYMDAQEAIDYGIVDEILHPASQESTEEETSDKG